MARHNLSLTGVEQFFDVKDIIVSKTDLKGRITYANDIFQQVSGYGADELIGQPHSIIRHPDMPRCVFKLLWDTIEKGEEIFAYVINRCKNGDHYWVYANVTASRDKSGNIISYHSNRRVPERTVVDNAIIPLYKTLLGEEQRHKNAKAGMAASLDIMLDLLKEKNMDYDEFLFSLAAA
ncbi:putative sensor (PAS) domain for methyl-accepting chemotaxis sensory transducer [hydrothermal vent metagenome]|uniref:Putative sensor (PAS) domain for methyl-accepting chemotaxis sensory transducer n=1 Tax=hydrothermal vent metagenome TaxID=652676 RepID=A0A3B0TXR3_9ZZZZ